MKMSRVFSGMLAALAGLVCLPQPLLAQDPPPEARATFFVVKGYDDFNPAPVEVTISCNTGIPLEQSATLSPTDDLNDLEFVEFVVVDFATGDLDCEISEEVPDGYFVNYLTINENQDVQTLEPCLFEGVEHGDVADVTLDPPFFDNVCAVLNYNLPSLVTVTKEWIDENPQFNPINISEASYSCTNLPDVDGFIEFLGAIPPIDGPEGIGDPESGFLEFIGNPGEDSFQTFGNWDGGTVCTVTETFVEGGLESDDSDCQEIVLFPGDDAECTIVNTRLFEGIPTLGRSGLVLLAMLMLGLGLVAYRRFA